MQFGSWELISCSRGVVVAGSQESKMVWTCNTELDVEADFNGNIVSSKTTCRDRKKLRLGGWKHLYPLCLSLYPTKTHKTIFGSNLWFLVLHVYGKHFEPNTWRDV